MVKEFKSFYKTVGGNEGGKCKYATRLDTYGCGCQHNCGYCYARSLLDFRGLWDAARPAVADIEKIKKKIEKIEPGTVVRLGGMTDCFMPLEKKMGVTYETIKALNFGDSISEISRWYGTGHDSTLFRGKITAGNGIDNNTLDYQVAREIRSGSALGKALNRCDSKSRGAIYALAKGYSYSYDNSSGYYMVYDRSCMTFSNTTKHNPGTLYQW